MLQLCTITLDPITGANGDPQVRETKTCTIQIIVWLLHNRLVKLLVHELGFNYFNQLRGQLILHGLVVLELYGLCGCLELHLLLGIEPNGCRGGLLHGFVVCCKNVYEKLNVMQARTSSSLMVCAFVYLLCLPTH